MFTWIAQKIKGWKTVWLGVLSAAIPILDQMGVVKVIPDEWLPWYTIGVSLGMIWLRYVTTTAIGAKE